MLLTNECVCQQKCTLARHACNFAIICRLESSQARQPQREALVNTRSISVSIWGHLNVIPKLHLFSWTLWLLWHTTAPTSSTSSINISSQCWCLANGGDKMLSLLNEMHLSGTCTQFCNNLAVGELTTKTTPKRSTYEHKKHQCLHLRSSACDS